MRETFYTDGRDLFDPTGNKVILRGVNKMSVWDGDDPTGAAYFPEIRKTQANSVRIVWAITKDLDAAGAKTDLDTLDTLITNARKNQLIPMVELHDATGKWGRLQELVNYWVEPDVVKLIQKHQAYLLVNIGNEVGDDKVTPTQFIAGYKKALKRLRDADIHTPLVIDASDWGKNLEILDACADNLIAADPDKNLIFSVHLYWPKSDGADAAFIQSKLQPEVERNFPLIVGEFSRYGAYAGEDKDGKARSICGEFGEIDYQTILKVADEQKIGWYAWEWGPGNAMGTPPDPLCVVMDMTPDGQFDHLKPGWATDVVDSIKTASEKPGYFSLPPLVELSPAIKTRIETLTAVLTNKTDKNAVSKALQQANGDWSIALASLTEKKFPEEALRTVALANSLADWTDDNVKLVTTLVGRPGVTNLRDVALDFNVAGLTKLVDPAAKVTAIKLRIFNFKSTVFSIAYDNSTKR